jgi:hypothetical protein
MSTPNGGVGFGLTGFGFNNPQSIAATSFVGQDFIITTNGAFFYSGTPAAGNLIYSIAPSGVTVDPFGNAVKSPGATAYNPANGNSLQIFPGHLTGTSQVIFFTGAAMENVAANLSTGIVGSGISEVLQTDLSGPRGNASGQDDWVQIQLQSGSDGSGGTAVGSLVYVEAGGAGSQTDLSWGNGVVDIPTISVQAGNLTGVTVNGLSLGTHAITSPGSAAGAAPTGTAPLAASCTAGSPLLAYLTALATTYNTTVTAVSNLVNTLSGWGV